MHYKYYLKKILIYLLTVIIAITIASLFGILHDQITYSISKEYYTKFKFYQFGLLDVGNEALSDNPRTQVAAVGILATWWVGKWIGILLGGIAFMAKESVNMRRALLNSLLLTFICTVIFAFIGFLRGKFYLVKTGVNWSLPDNLIDKDNFIIVGSIHNYSYLGGAIGLLIAAIYLIWKAKQISSTNPENSINSSASM